MELSRRNFATLLFKAGLLSLWSSPLKSLAAGNKLPAWAELIEYARWCPTVHNLQPHLVKVISDNKAELYCNPQRLLPHGDPQAVFATVAMGIFIEHLSIAASASGYQVVVETIHQPIKTNATENILFATLRLEEHDDLNPIDRALMLNRRTSRLQYNGKPVPDSITEELSRVASQCGYRLQATQSEKLIDDLMELNQQTLFEDLRSEAMCTELDHLFRYNKEEAAEKKDGLWSECMGYSGSLMKSVFQHPQKWLEGWKSKLLANYYKSSFKGTQTLCWISGAFDNTEDWLAAGKALTRVWLTLTRHGAYLQPFGSLITNPSAYGAIQTLLPANPTAQKTWLIFRAGYSKEPARSYRLSTDQILI